MEIDITHIANLNAFPLSHSMAEGGENAGRNTWDAAQESARSHALLDTPEKLEAMREFVESSGGWTREEIDEWTDNELNAIFLQWIAGDCRELGADSIAEIDWEEAEQLQRAGQAPSNLFRADDGRIFFYLGN